MSNEELTLRVKRLEDALDIVVTPLLQFLETNNYHEKYAATEELLKKLDSVKELLRDADTLSYYK